MLMATKELADHTAVTITSHAAVLAKDAPVDALDSLDSLPTIG